jgi:hypothetical protein
MKFLTFNIVVAAALGYLLMGDKPEIRHNDVVAKLTTSAGNAWDKARDSVEAATDLLAETPIPEPDPLPLPQVHPIPEPVATQTAKAAPEPKPDPQPTPVMVRRAPAPKGQEVEVTKAADVPPVSAVQIENRKAERVAKKDPAAARRRAEVLGIASAPVERNTRVASAVQAKPKFMSPSDRRRELLRLAEDMELQFLDTVKQ